MTVESTVSRVSYTGSGTTGPFTIPFYFLADEDIRAIKVTIADGAEDELALTTDFTLTGEGDPDGGELTLVASISSSYRLVIFRDPEVLQETSWPRNDPFPAESHEEAADRLTMISQRDRDIMDRSLRAPDGDPTTVDLVLPPAVERASMALGFDSDGNPIAIESGSAVEEAANITFAQTGTGAEGTTVEDELLANGIRPEQFGAAGDGTTDDTAAFAAAVTEAKASGRKIFLRSPVYKANIAITGENVHIEADVFHYNASGTVGIVPATLTDPALAIGDGTTTTRNISIRGVSLYGGQTGDKGLRIYGADNVYISNFTSRGFEQYQIQLDSSATKSTFFVFIDGFHIQNGTTAGSLGVDFNYGSSFTTAIYMSNGAMNANAGAHLVDLNGSGAILRLVNVWIEAADGQGLNFGSGTLVECANVTIDSSSSSHILATIASNTSVSEYIRGTFTMDGKVTMPGGNTAALSGHYFFPNETTLNNPHVEGSLRFLDAGANAWDRYSYVTSMNIARSGNNLAITNSLGNVNVTPTSTGRLNVIGQDLTLTAANGQQIASSHVAASVNTTSGATVSSSNLIPANSLVLGVTIRVTTLVEGATSISIGDGTDADRWGAGIAVAADTTTNIANFTITGPVYYAAATSVVLTAGGSNFTAGAVRITVHYIKLTAATS